MPRRRKLAAVPNDKDAAAIPDNPRIHPEETVDALEERALGHIDTQSREDAEDGSPAIEQDIDAEDLSSSDVSGTEPSD